MKQYQILIHEETVQKAESYLNLLETRRRKIGAYLQESLVDKDISQLTVLELVELLVRTKRPQIFAESDVFGEGTDWNQTELSILGDIGIAVSVTVYDDGLHHQPNVHAVPFGATLLYIPGTLLQNGRGHIPADWDEVVMDNHIDFDAFYALYERRLLPSFLYANRIATSKNKQALITVPGLGCGMFAGKFRGELGFELRHVLAQFLEEHNGRFPHIRAVYFDPYQECDNERIEIEHISFLVRPLTKGNQQKSQLCPPQQYEEKGDDFSNCDLFSFVAWDHVSWPGNDFYIGSRATDDGVKAAATDSMATMTGIEGQYHTQTNTYDPPKQYKNWEDVVLKEGVQIDVTERNLSMG